MCFFFQINEAADKAWLAVSVLVHPKEVLDGVEIRALHLVKFFYTKLGKLVTDFVHGGTVMLKQRLLTQRWKHATVRL